MKVFIKGKGTPVNLSKNDFVTQGGEASIYIRQDTVFKVHLDQKRVTKEAKILELKELDCVEIIRPMDLLIDQKDQPVGFTMRLVKDAIALCKLFTTDFWKRNSITAADIGELVDRMREIISFIHQHKGFLMVDGNEFNYLVAPLNAVYRQPFFIDVDSYQTPSFPATAIMPTVRDWHTNGFDHGSDWFSFAVVAFQLFAGIHPYKGRHPDFQKGDMESRMKANVSVFHKDVSCPAPMRPLNGIPKNYFDWFFNIFESGKRLEPPSKAGKAEVLQVAAVVIGGMDAFKIEKIHEFDVDILYYGINGQNEIIKLANKTILINRKDYAVSSGEEAIISTKSGEHIFCSYQDGMLVTRNSAGAVTRTIGASDMVVYDNHVYTFSVDKLFEVSFVEFKNGRPVPIVTQSMDILPHATTMLSGVVHMNVLGVHHFILPEPAVIAGDAGKFHVQALRELDGHRIIDAKRIETVLVVTSHKDGKYHRFLFRFDAKHQTHDVHILNDISYAGINMTVLAQGVLLIVNPDGTLEVMKPFPSITPPKVFAGFNPDAKLYSSGTKAMFTKGNALYSISMK